MQVKRILLLALLLITACQQLPTTAPTTQNSAIVTFQISTPTLPTTVSLSPTPTLPASVVELAGAEVQPGFSLTKFADLPRPTAFAFDTAGRLYVTSQDGNIYRLTDENKDGRADSTFTFASGYTFPLGIAVQNSTGDVYLSYQGVISVLSDGNGDGSADQERILAGDLPFGEHQNDNLQFGPDGWLYVGVGSACDACQDSNPLSASILRINVETREKQIFATGLRNPYGIAFDPQTGQLFATDNGRDKLGMDTPFEELNHIVQGGDYGYPNCWNEQNQPGCENTIPAIAFFEAHSSADGLAIYDGQNFPAEYRGNAFVSIFGSWLKPDVQTGIQRVILVPKGNTYSTETSWFVRFPQGVMPLPVTVGPEGALYIGDYINGAIYRLSYGTPS